MVQVDTIPSVESLLRQQHQELLDAFTRLEARHKQVVADSEKQISNLKRQNQKLLLENESLHTATSSPPAVVSQLPEHLARQLIQIKKVTSKLGLQFHEPKDLEVEALSFVLCGDYRLRFLKHFLENGPHTPSLAGLPYCVDQILRGIQSMAVHGKKGTSCNGHKNRDVCVWVIKRENGWAVGSGPAS